MNVLNASDLTKSGMSPDSRDFLSFTQKFGEHTVISLEVCKSVASDFRWDHMAATLLDDAHHDVYMDDIDEPLRDFARAQYEARLHHHATADRKGVTGHHVSKAMRFHRAKLQEAKARAFAFAYGQQMKGAAS